MDFSITAKDGSARVGSISTAHGDIQTPAFMPVATAGAVKALGMDDMEALHAQILMANTFHLHLKIGEQLVGAHGGLHGFSSWHRPFMTDSGGFQAFSLGFGMEHGVGKIASIFPDEVTGERREQGKAGGD
ncbi:tRNA guanosine(34) transglycosylase Tgt, partial [Candidatus Woesearchaeota archaeon CG_4_10_14_0_2_um_filter_57_5]